MNVVVFAAVWLVLAVASLPLALLLLVLAPILWLLSLPFRLAALVIDAIFAFTRAVLFLPSRLLGGGPRS